MQVPFKFVIPDYPLMVHSVDWKSNNGLTLTVKWDAGWIDLITEKYGAPDAIWTDVSLELAKHYLESGQWVEPSKDTAELAYLKLRLEGIEEDLASLKAEFIARKWKW